MQLFGAAACFLFTSVSSLTYGNIQRLEQLHLRGDE